MVNRLLMIIALALAAVAAPAQITVYSTSDNVSDLNPERDALSAPAGTIRLTTLINNGGEVLDLSTAALPIPLSVTHRTDGWTSPIAPALETVAAEGKIRWQFTLQPGEYEVKAIATFSNDEFPVYWRYISVFPAPSAEVSVNVTNQIQSTLIINLEGNTVAEIVQP